MVIFTCDFSIVALCLSHIGLMSKFCSRSLSPCWKNSSINKLTHRLYSSSGLVGLLKSAQCTKFCKTYKIHVEIYRTINRISIELHVHSEHHDNDSIVAEESHQLPVFYRCSCPATVRQNPPLSSFPPWFLGQPTNSCVWTYRWTVPVKREPTV